MELAFKNVIQLLDHFKDESTCTEFLELKLWNGKPVCPHCGSVKTPYKTTRGYKCSDSACYKKFTVTTGTYFHSSKLPLRVWFGAIYLCTAHKKGVSSHQLARDLGVTQKTAWFVLHRVREMLKDKAPQMITGEVQADETFIGGSEENKHQSAIAKRKKADEKRENDKLGIKTSLKGGRSLSKQGVIGVINDGKVIAKPVPDTTSKTLIDFISENVEKGATVVTDEYQGYQKLKVDFTHVTVKHRLGEYTNGKLHTNSIEGFWSQLKRGIYGIYHQVSPKHLGAYCNEFAYRYNTRKVTDQERFFNTLTLAHGRLTYEDLISE